MSNRNTKRRPPRPTPPAQKWAPEPITPDEAADLATDLLRELAEHVGNPEAVDATLLGWLDREDVRRLALIALASVQLVFGECLTRVDLDQVPPGSLALIPPEGDNAA